MATRVRSASDGEETARLLAGTEVFTGLEARELIDVPDAMGAHYTPHCAAIHPGRLVRGLATAVERRGAVVYERSPAIAIEPGRVVTANGTVLARHVVRATEGYTAGLPGLRRAVVPVYSLMVATEPLPAASWEQIGLASRPTFSELRHVITYGQRTADGRLAFGGRGAPYRYASRTRPGLRPASASSFSSTNSVKEAGMPCARTSCACFSVRERYRS
jgi:glycine/D-amino acid oxidase-like deaminating enzyme